MMIVPLPQIGWSDRLTYSGDTRTRTGGLLRQVKGPEAIWRPCAWCWGQREIWQRMSWGMCRMTCPACLGLGDVPALEAA